VRSLPVAVASLTVGIVVGGMLAPTRTAVEYETVVKQVPLPTMGTAPTWQEALDWETPVADSLVDLDEVDRQTECLWVFLTDHFGNDLTMDRVLAAGAWVDSIGGACAVIGQDD
jgi:hypothetical protein